MLFELAKQKLVGCFVMNSLAETILELGWATKSQIAEALKAAEESGRTLEYVLLRRNIINPQKLSQAKAKIFGLEFIDLKDSKVPPEVLKQIPEETAVFYKFVPFEKSGNILKVAMVNPDDLQAQEALRFLAARRGLQVKIYVVTQNDLENIAKQYRSLRGEVDLALKALESELGTKPTDKGKIQQEAKRIVAEAPITKIVAVIVRHATEGRASDIHIEAMEDNVRVRFRVDGVLYTGLFLPKNIHSAVVARIKILCHMRIDENRVPQDGRFSTVISDRKIDFRVSTLPTTTGEKVVMRILDPKGGALSFTELGIVGDNARLLESAIDQPFGLILTTGPTGSGKTTTQYSVLHILNNEEVNIISLEDPVEYYVEGVNQSQVRPEIGYTFASGLRHILRQDPDVIMVGEIRDQETAELSIHAALTGHLVLSTLHTNDAVGVIPRLIDMGIQPFLLPSTLLLVVAQRLVRRLCVQCRQSIDPPAPLKQVIATELIDIRERLKTKALPEVLIKNTALKVYSAPGCKYCGNKGSRGRIGIYEMLKMTKELEKIIIEKPMESVIGQEAKRQGMLTMKQDGILKALEGLVSLEEVLKAVESKTID